MALTLPRWLAFAVILCGTAFLVVLREVKPPVQREFDTDDRRRESLAGLHLGRASERLRFVQLLDSLRSSSASLPAGHVTFGANVPVAAERVLRELLTRVARARPAQAHVPVDMVFLVDTAAGAHGASRLGFAGWLRTDYVLPSDSSGRCLVVGRIRVSAVAGGRTQYANLLNESTQRRLLGPCGFFEAFGMPSRSVRGWLDQRGWDIALTSVTDAPNPAWRPPQPWFARDFFNSWSPDFRLRGAMSMTGFACTAGEMASCDSAVLSAVGPRTNGALIREATLWNGKIVSPAWGIDVGERDWWWIWNSTGLGPRQSTVLSEMARTIGRDRFARFWTADEPVGAAFQENAGVSVGEWTTEWARRMYTRPSRGPGVPTTAFFIGVTLAALSLGYAATRAARRQVA